MEIKVPKGQVRITGSVEAETEIRLPCQFGRFFLRLGDRQTIFSCFE